MAGNWKMNPATEDDAVKLGSALTELLGDETCAIDAENDMCVEVVVFPPFPFISKVKDCVEDGKFLLLFAFSGVFFLWSVLDWLTD